MASPGGARAGSRSRGGAAVEAPAAASSSPGGVRAGLAGGGGGGAAEAAAVATAASLGVGVRGGAGGRRGGAEPVDPAWARSTPAVAAAVAPDIIIGVHGAVAEADLDDTGCVEGRGDTETPDPSGTATGPPQAVTAAASDASVRAGGHGSRVVARTPDPATFVVGRVGEVEGEEEGEGEGEGRVGGAGAWEAAGAAGGGVREAVRSGSSVRDFV
ncbi:predicted GPI-anchored protein 23 [Miscanthus floridulus]|uniref:predicted GPI-anchored protein 23 n=1 Tax=Miscanthus floridulus TaxID=154761 RepID=UPI003459910F